MIFSPDTVCPHWLHAVCTPWSVEQIMTRRLHGGTDWMLGLPVATERDLENARQITARIEIRGLLKQAGYNPDHFTAAI